MEYKIGSQYSKDRITDKTGFLEKARLHQSKYRAEVLHVDFDTYGNYLTTEDANKGLNFYDDFDIFHEVKKRYKNYSKPLYANLLRSEHIGFNLFIPFKHDLEFAKIVFNNFMDNTIKSIDSIQIEYAPENAEKYLNDKTSFDTYIEYTNLKDERGIIGIEVKYTEHEYALKSGSKQEKDILNKESKYYQVTDQSNIYKDGVIDTLITDLYRQVWRNQLLGESIVLESNNDFKHFSSLTIFPKGNVHFVEVSEKYKEMLINNERKFIALTYENFLDVCEKNAPNERYGKWINYLTNRYIVK